MNRHVVRIDESTDRTIYEVVDSRHVGRGVYELTLIAAGAYLFTDYPEKRYVYSDEVKDFG